MQGVWAERLAAQHFIQRGYQLIFHRHKVFGTEHDLVFRLHAQHYLFVEVKTILDEDQISWALSQGQLQRLLRSVEAFAIYKEVQAEICLVGILPNAQCIVIPLDWDSCS